MQLLFSWQSLGREISAQLQRISQLRMEPRMLSEQFNKPLDGTTNFDSPSGITKKYTCTRSLVVFFNNECRNNSGQSHRTAKDNSMNFLSRMFVIVKIIFFFISFSNRYLCALVSLCCGHFFQQINIQEATSTE